MALTANFVQFNEYFAVDFNEKKMRRIEFAICLNQSNLWTRFEFSYSSLLNWRNEYFLPFPARGKNENLCTAIYSAFSRQHLLSKMTNMHLEHSNSTHRLISVEIKREKTHENWRDNVSSINYHHFHAEPLCPFFESMKLLFLFDASSVHSIAFVAVAYDISF